MPHPVNASTSNSTTAGASVVTRRGLRDITNVAGGSRATNGKGAENQPSAKPTAKPTTSNSVPAQEAPNLPPRPHTAGASSGPDNDGAGSASGVSPPLELSSSGAATYNPKLADDIDARDSSNPLAVTTYVQEIYAHLRVKEVVGAVDATYMARQPHVNEKMRAILVDWLVECHQKFRCVPETLYLTVSLVDRYLEAALVERSKLQLVGVTALLIAAKYEEVYPPELRDLVHITDKAYSEEDIVRMESSMLRALDFKVAVASTHSFLVRYLKAAHADRRAVWLACFLAERCLSEYSTLPFLPSVVASSAVFLARKNCGRSPWSPTLVKYSGYDEAALGPCLREMTAVLASKTSLTAAKKKYSSHKFGGVASMAIEGV